MPLPRVAHLSTGAAGPRGPISPSADRGAFGAAPESRALRYEKGGAMQSLLFPDAHQPPPQKPSPPKQPNNSSYITSSDHPLMMPAGVVVHDEARGARHHPTASYAQMHGLAAGAKSKRSETARSALTGRDAPGVSSLDAPLGRKPLPPGGERMRYQHPTYAVGRGISGGEARSLLYPEPAVGSGRGALAAEALGVGPAIKAAYDALCLEVPQLPRDGDGNVDEASMMGALARRGIAISVDGFAELLARCDVSPHGFPSIADFVRCLERGPREAAPAAASNLAAAEAVARDEAAAAAAEAAAYEAARREAAAAEAAAAEAAAREAAAAQAAEEAAERAAVDAAAAAYMARGGYRGGGAPPTATEAAQDDDEARAAQYEAYQQQAERARDMRGRMPLGARSHVAPIGTGMKSIYAGAGTGKKSHALNGQFTKAFPKGAFDL